MDVSYYKDFTTSRGFTYHYYFSPAQAGRPTLILAHGFSSLSAEWDKVVAHYEPLGYGLIVPDLLGYGGTSKPNDPQAYKQSLMTKDIVEILDSHGLDKVVAIGHDWGSGFVSRLYNHYPERLLAVAFLALWTQRKKNGYENFGYWYFFTSDDAAQVIEKNFDRWLDLLWGTDDGAFRTYFAPTGARRKYLTAGDPATGKYASYITPEYKKLYTESMIKGGLQGPLNWCCVHVKGYGPEDDKSIPLERYNVDVPVFYAATLKDVVCRPDIGKPIVQHFCKNTTIKEYDCGHWVMSSMGDQLSKDLQKWIDGLGPAN